MTPTPLNSTFRQFAQMFLGRTHVDEDIAFANTLDRKALDGSIESLTAVDAYLAQVKSQLASLSEKQQNDIALRCGAYLGECIRMTWPEAYDWTDYNAYMPEHPELQAAMPVRTFGTGALLLRLPDTVLTPVKHVLECLHDGPGASVQQYADAERQHHKAL